MKRAFRLFLSLIFVVLLACSESGPITRSAAAASAEVTTYETGYAVDPVFQDFFAAHGGVEIFGLPLTASGFEDGRLVQYFERNRFEAHSENDVANSVLIGRLGAYLTTGREFAAGPTVVPADGVRFAETGHTLSGGFLAYWQSHDGLRIFGLPLSEPLQESSADNGNTYWVQYFERARMEWHPENAGTGYEILLGRLGAQLLANEPELTTFAKKPSPSPNLAPSANSTPVSAPTTASGGAALGVYLAMLPWQPSALDDYIEQTGAAPKSVMLYVDWARAGQVGGSDFPQASLQVIANHGATAVVTWEPWNPDLKTASQPTYSDAAIAGGSHDAYIRDWAKAAKAWGQPFSLRLAHEMNTTSYPWGTGSGNANGNTAAQYIAMWRHVHDIFLQEGVTNVTWVWSPNTESADGQFAALYPGDAYVDWVGMDGYNGGSALPWGGWLSFAQVFDRSYNSLQRVAPTKPIMIGETGSAEAGGSKATWITQGFLTDLPTKYPKIKMVIWYNWDLSSGGQSNWRIDSSSSALAAWKQVVTSALYR